MLNKINYDPFFQNLTQFPDETSSVKAPQRVQQLVLQPRLHRSAHSGCFLGGRVSHLAPPHLLCRMVLIGSDSRFVLLLAGLRYSRSFALKVS